MKGYNQILLKDRIKPKHQRISPLVDSHHHPVSHSDGLGKSEPGGRFSVIGKLESSVSMLQIAKSSIEKSKGWLGEMKEFLEKEVSYGPISNLPETVINNFLADRLNQIKMTAEAASFQGKALLNGNSGVRGESTSDHLRFVKGSARVISSSEEGYPVAITREPRPAYLVGMEQMKPETLRDESMIIISEGSVEVKYRMQVDENPESLVRNLQQMLLNHGLDISVFRTSDDHLLFRHNQPGSTLRFKGLSYNTRLVSVIPSQYRYAFPGEDVAGTIASEPARGDGGFLIGQKGNRLTDGLILYFNGRINAPGEVVGMMKVTQNGIIVPLDSAHEKAEILSLPALIPSLHAVGVGNRSGFSDLSSIRGNDQMEKKDALKLIVWSMLDLGYLLDELKRKEDSYVERAMELLKDSFNSKPAGEEILYLSKEKAGEMAEQLKTMITPSMVMKSTLYG